MSLQVLKLLGLFTYEEGKNPKCGNVLLFPGPLHMPRLLTKRRKRIKFREASYKFRNVKQKNDKITSR